MLFTHELREHSARAEYILWGIGLTLVGMVAAGAVTGLIMVGPVAGSVSRLATRPIELILAISSLHTPARLIAGAS